jgi:hypothetical protein
MMLVDPQDDSTWPGKRPKLGFKSRLLRRVNTHLKRRGFEIVRPWHNENIKSYLPFQETLAAAGKVGLSIGDYIDAAHQRPGATQETIDKLVGLGILKKGVRRICEIGSGSGRYLQKTLEICQPEYCEVYETDQDWVEWLARTYKVTAQPADGISLGPTPSGTVDLILAHKLFVYVPFVTTCMYFAEMARVVGPRGAVAFDIVSEECMDEKTVKLWAALKYAYPCMMPRQYAIDFMHRLGLTFEASFFSFLKPGRSEYMVFTKR